MTIRTILVDDEPLATQGLQLRLQAHDDVEVIATAANGRDAVRLLLKYCFWEQRYHKCNSACLHNNPASIRLHEKLGFRQEGCRREVCFMNGQYYDEVLFGLTREEFDAIKMDVG